MPNEHTVDLVLDPDVVRALHRRGRRRLRDIQTSSRAALKLDRLRSVLRVTGTKESIADVQRQVECVLGSYLSVAPALWAELMRTRANPDISLAAVARIQHETGCRIHIERNSQQVQLFGPQETAKAAQRLVDQLAHMCVEETVDKKLPLDMDLQWLQLFAEDFGVTLQVEEKHLTIYGIEGAVAEAARELHHYDCEGPYSDPNPSNIARLAIKMAMTKLTLGSMRSSQSTTPGSLSPVSSMHSLEDTMQGAVTVKMPASPVKGRPQQRFDNMQEKDFQQAYESCPTCGHFGNFCVSCGKPTGKMMQNPVAGCPTCGVVNFCAFCGQPTEKMVKMENAVPMQQKAPSYAPIQMMPMQAMQFVQTMHNGNQLLVPVARCVPYDESGPQEFPVFTNACMPGNSTPSQTMLFSSMSNWPQAVMGS